jgi:hypothetical protein
VVACALAVGGTYLPGPPLVVAAIASVVFVAASVALGAIGIDDVRALRGAPPPIDPSVGAE